MIKSEDIKQKIPRAMGILLLLALVSAPLFADKADGKDTISIGYQPSTHQIAFMTAYEKGYYNESLGPLGVKNVKAYNFPTGAPEMQAMLSGDLDAAYVGSAPVVTAVSNGLDAKIVASVNTQGSDLVIQKDKPYTSPKDLKGLTIATFPAGTIQDTILRNWLTKNGINPDTDLTIKAMGPGDATTAFLAGKVDGVFLPHPSPVTLEEQAGAKVVARSGDMDPGHACCVLVVSGDLIRNHPDIVKALVQTHLKATDYVATHTDEAAGDMQSLTGLAQKDILTSLKEWDGSFVSDPQVIEKSVDDFTKIQTDLGYLKNPVNNSALFDTSFYSAKA